MVVLVVVTITTGTKTATDLELYTNLLKLTSSRDLLRKMVIKLCTQEEEEEEEEEEKEEEVRNSYSLLRFKNEITLITYQEWRFNFESNNILIVKNMIKIARIESYITKINQIFRVQKMHVILMQFLKPNSCKSSSSSSSSNIHVFSSLLIDIVDICVIFLSMIRRIY